MSNQTATMNQTQLPTGHIPIALLYGVVAVMLISGVYLLVTLTAPVCGLINIVLGGLLIASDVSGMNPTRTHPPGGN